MLVQGLMLLTVISSAVWAVPKVDVAEYLRQHAELLAEDADGQMTSWDSSSLPPGKNLTYPVENQPVHEVKVDLSALGHGRRQTHQGQGQGQVQRKHGMRNKIRERRQINPDSCYLFFANRVHLIQLVNVPSLTIDVVLTGFNNTVAVDFDKRDGFLFWSDVVTHIIYRSRTNGSDVTELVNTSITTPDGLAWDWINKKLYWTDAGDSDLEVYDPSTGCRKVLFQFEAASRPRAIVLDPRTGWMYWTDWGLRVISRASMDGCNHTVLHDTDLWWPNALTIDYDNQILYWMDAALDRLESSNTDGSNRLLVSTLHIYHPFGLTFIQGQLFWSDWQVNAILSTSLSNLSTVYITFGDLSLDPLGITAACLERQEAVPNRCDGKCNNFCLLSSSLQGHSCTCPDDCKTEKTEKAGCAQSCGENGNCTTGHNRCTCNDGWRGSTCAQGVCEKGCVHGDCTAPDVCTCDPGWEGDDCNNYTAECCASCGDHGSCTSSNTTCTVPGGCLNGGSCKLTYCDCPKHYIGERCEKMCNPLFQDC